MSRGGKRGMDEWETLNAIGIQLYSSQAFDLALEAFEKAAGADPSHPIVFFNLGMTNRALGREREAKDFLAAYERACRRACPYFPGRRRDDLESLPCRGTGPAELDALLEKGFRRTGDTISRNVCPDCRDCVQIRFPLGRLEPSRGQRRVLRRNAGVRIEVIDPPRPDPRKAELMGRYMKERHGWREQDMAEELESYYSGWGDSREFAYWRGERLVMVAILDSGEKDLYASACFFDPAFARDSPGVFNLLTAMEWGAAAGYRYLYTGEYIESRPNMRYKRFFRPHEVLAEGGRWIEAD